MIAAPDLANLAAWLVDFDNSSFAHLAAGMQEARRKRCFPLRAGQNWMAVRLEDTHFVVRNPAVPADLAVRSPAIAVAESLAIVAAAAVRPDIRSDNSVRSSAHLAPEEVPIAHSVGAVANSTELEECSEAVALAIA